MITEIRTQVPGNVWKLLVKVGDAVTEGQVLFIMELMKTEIAHEAPAAGTVSAIHITEGQQGVEVDMVAVEIT